MPAYTWLITVLFTFGSAIFIFLLLMERRVWTLSADRKPTDRERDTRFVHGVLRHMIPVLPPANGVVVIGGLACLVWQGVARGWDWRADMVLAWWVVLQAYILTIGRIASAIREVRDTDSEADLAAVARGVLQLVRQHRNGLVHALGTLALETALIGAPTLG